MKAITKVNFLVDEVFSTKGNLLKVNSGEMEISVWFLSQYFLESKKLVLSCKENDTHVKMDKEKKTSLHLTFQKVLTKR